MTTKKRSLQGKPGGLSQAPYSLFASIYDACMDHVPYEQWADYLDECAWRLLGRRPENNLDLACGTGLLLAQLLRRPGRFAGVDGAPQMAAVARRRLPLTRIEVASLCGPTPFAARSFDRITCCHDSLNYLSAAELKQAMVEVARLLPAGGLYSVDLATLSNMRDWFDGRLIRRRIRGISLRWSNRYLSASNELISTLRMRTNDGRLIVEQHRQRFIDPAELIAAAGAAGLRLALREGDYSKRPPGVRDSLWNFHFLREES
ncbi:MAG: class I SAM-dependent methyltransferase [Leptospirales bacterium]|nr:class I SAM-dependent methyltransferase [Leptospirales bacterium]